MGESTKLRMIRLGLWWTTPTGDIALGSGYHTHVPPPRGLIYLKTRHGSYWRITEAHDAQLHDLQRDSAGYGTQLDLHVVPGLPPHPVGDQRHERTRIPHRNPK